MFFITSAWLVLRPDISVGFFAFIVGSVAFNNSRSPSKMASTTEALLPIRQALRQKLGVDVSPATAWRWAKRGCRGSRLKTKRVGKRLFVTAADVDAFIAGQQVEPLADVPAPILRTAEDERALRAAGLLN